jgi:hypothetical protein
MMSITLNSPFLGVPIRCDVNRRIKASSYYPDGRKVTLRFTYKCRCSKQNDWISHGIRFSNFCGRNVELLWRNLGLRSSNIVVNCVKEPLTKSRALVKSLAPLWEEGLFLFRCSVFCAVISGVCLLVWYGQAKAKNLIEVKVLPSVCAAVSEYIQREVEFGKVRRISPLSITLETCSIGPHHEEFSCAEVPTVKLRILPFSSLRRGKIVIDAVLSNPTLLVAQKKNYTWLGIPFVDGNGNLQRHMSTEEGIDHRTKTRRTAREEGAARAAQERDAAAQEAAETGYSVSEEGSTISESSDTQLTAFESVLAMEERLHWRDHHCMDAGVEYDLKHADLEKSFGVNSPVSGVKFWSRIIPGSLRQKFKRKANGRDTCTTDITAKRRILDHSSTAARVYFKALKMNKDVINGITPKDEVQVEEPNNNLKDELRIQNLPESNRVVVQGEDLVRVETFGVKDSSFGDNTEYIDVNAVNRDVDKEDQIPESSDYSSQYQEGHSSVGEIWSQLFEKLKSKLRPQVEEIVAELVEGVDDREVLAVEKMFPVSLDSVHFNGGTLMLLAYGDTEPREMENASGHVNFQNHYGRVHVQLSGNCKMWRSNLKSEDGEDIVLSPVKACE